MALKDITLSSIQDYSYIGDPSEGFMATEVRGWDVFVTGSQGRGYRAKITLLWDDEGSDAHVDMEEEAVGDTIAELKEDIMYHINHLGYKASQVKRMAKKLEFTGNITALQKLMEDV